ncbi:signal peptidase I [Sulfurimonas sp. CVO]|jgi:signal peptidase I|uniref:Signal peptidase I n=1 Tax=Sulfurimonas xiamenensis TaxID=2590021 RepID=A0AAJ4A3Q1_9BACT|nr:MULTISPECIES: signal peptidase I [Sulfurimonas]QFR43332.1 signal peptidase I [Sulfurimonas xiamenensis]QHG91107.1 signal peptidase I [Sulfurimonas sp. CVO]
MKNFLHKTYKFSNSWTGTIIIVLFVIFFIAQAFKIPSGSMKDSLLIGDHLFAKKFAYGIPMPHIPFLETSIMPWSDRLRLMDGDTPKRGDIVIFRPPHNTKQHFVKRCVALPNDELFILDKDLYIHHHEGDKWIENNFKEEDIIIFAGKLWVKNPYMKEHPGIHHDKKITNNGQYPMPIFNFAPIKIDEDHYFMMGDNRDHSNDSRFWGAVPYENIEGTPWFVYFSIDENWEIRWDRIGKTPTDLETPAHLNKAIAERIKKDKDDYGIY